MPLLASGAVATVSAAYLARMRTSDEPELSIQRIDRLDRFIRECRVFEFQLNSGSLLENDQDAKLKKLQQRLEDILKHPTATPGVAEHQCVYLYPARTASD
jgi:SMODS and SLOG-associating 2TM effector domain